MLEWYFMLQDSTDYIPFGGFSKIFRFSTGYMLKPKLMTELPLTWLKHGCQTSLACSVALPMLYCNGEKTQHLTTKNTQTEKTESKLKLIELHYEFYIQHLPTL